MNNDLKTYALTTIRRLWSWFRWRVFIRVICMLKGHDFYAVDMNMTYRQNYDQTYVCIRCYQESESSYRMIPVVLD